MGSVVEKSPNGDYIDFDIPVVSGNPWKVSQVRDTWGSVSRAGQAHGPAKT
jgi:hypothetical protein